MDKPHIRQTMLDLEREHFETTRAAYLDYIASARIDSSEPIENDERAQAIVARDLSEAFDQPLHEHGENLRRIQQIDFGPKSEVAEGAIVRIAGRNFVVAVASDRFACDGDEFMGISTKAPLFLALEGKAAGETCRFNGRDLKIELVA